MYTAVVVYFGEQYWAHSFKKSIIHSVTDPNQEVKFSLQLQTVRILKSCSRLKPFSHLFQLKCFFKICRKYK